VPLDVQRQLLRVLEEEAVTRLGGTEPRPVDVRIVAATHRNLDDEVEADSVYDFAAQEIALLEPQLEGFRLLVDDPIELDCGEPAYRAIFCWYPEDDLKLYQEQIYVLPDERGYTLTASFTRNTRKQLGAAVERMMLSFTPIEEEPSS
jgi:hypothetical protein